MVKNKVSDKKQIEELKKYIKNAEESLESAKKALADITGEEIPEKSSSNTKTPPSLKVTPDGKIIEGIFNGENMIGPEEKVFSVPANYASKSKLVEGDKLKLTVAEDGSFIFKQIGPVERKKLVGDLSFEDNAYYVKAEGKKYSLLYATVTFHKAKPGDKVTIVVPANTDSNWAALENIIHDVAPKGPDPEDTIDLGLPSEKTEEPPVLVAETAPIPPPSPPAQPPATTVPFPTPEPNPTNPQPPPVAVNTEHPAIRQLGTELNETGQNTENTVPVDPEDVPSGSAPNALDI